MARMPGPRKLSGPDFVPRLVDNQHPARYKPKGTNMKRSDRIRRVLNRALKPEKLDIIDESSRHAGHSGAREGGETHYRIEVVSAEFIDKTRVARERTIHALLADEFADGLHALSIKARTPDESG